MERLTQDGFDYCKEKCSKETAENCTQFVGIKCGDAAIYERLREYKRTEYSPEDLKRAYESDDYLARLARWLQANQEGRLLVLPKLVTIDGLKERLVNATRMKRLKTETYDQGYTNGFAGGFMQALRLVLGVGSAEKEAELLSAAEENKDAQKDIKAELPGM